MNITDTELNELRLRQSVVINKNVEINMLTESTRNLVRALMIKYGIDARDIADYEINLDSGQIIKKKTQNVEN